MKKCLINVEGGLGKNVMLTAILEEFKRKKGYDEIYVISPYFDVFKACSAVTDAFPPMQGTLYQELVLDDDCDVYWKEPYSNQKFIRNSAICLKRGQKSSVLNLKDRLCVMYHSWIKLNLNTRLLNRWLIGT